LASSSNFMSVDDVNKKLDEGLENVFKSDRFKELLSVMSRMHHYSLNNAILIAIQKPNATMVQGYKGWQELGRYVQKGEKQIKILAPMFKKVEVEKIDPVTKKPELNNKGEVIREKKDFRTGFISVGVFDISQTDGKEIPSVRDFINRGLENDDSMKKLYHDFFNHIKDNSHYNLREDVTDPGVGGYYSRAKDEIVISSNNNQNDTEKFRVLVHEFAHAKLHHIDSDMKDLPRGHKEAQAESVAYIVSNYYGLETDDVSLGYIATWAQDIKLARKALEEVQSVAKEIINTIDELQKDKVLSFYNDHTKDYDSALEYIKNRYSINLETITKENKPQFEVLHKETGMVVSAVLDYSDKNEQYLLKTNKNMIIPLSEIDRKGDYAILNEEIKNGQLISIDDYKRVPNLLEITEMGNGKYAVTEIGGVDIFSKEFVEKSEAEHHLLKLSLSQSLHQQSLLNSMKQEHEVNIQVQERMNTNNIQINYDVSKFLTYGTDKIFNPKEKDGQTIGWALLKNKSIDNLEKLNEFAFNKTKNMPTYKNLREAITNSNGKTAENKETKNKNMEIEM
jgi:hypothetical protein